jgi:hypothetical protein
LSKASSLLASTLHSASWGCAAAGENRAPTSVLAGDGGVTRRNLLEGIVAAACFYPLVLLRGNPRSGSPGSDDGDATYVVLPLGALFLEQLRDGGGFWWSGIHLPHRRR